MWKEVLKRLVREWYSLSKPEKTAGNALRRIFKQDDILGKIEEQPASFSLLMNPTRMKIFIHLCQNPCDHTRSIALAICTSLTTVNWHLGQLLEYGYLEARMVNCKKLYWPAGMLMSTGVTVPEDAEIISCLRHEIPPKILNIISKNPGARQKHIVEKMQMKQQNIDFWLNKMEKCRIILRKGKGMGTTFHISEHFTAKITDYDEAARIFSKVILKLLYNDGLMPKNARFKGSRMGVDVKLPSGNRRIHLECSPLACSRGQIHRPVNNRRLGR